MNSLVYCCFNCLHIHLPPLLNLLPSPSSSLPDPDSLPDIFYSR